MSSETSLADAGVRAIKTGKYAEGIANLTKALKTRGAPLWHLERSKAHLRMNQFEHALYDAEMALRIAFDRANRHQMADAQIRRAITFFRMGRVAEADVCAFWAMRLADGARAMEDDGQQRKVDGNGDYIVRLAEVEAEGKPKTDAAMNTALNSKSIRTKEFSLRNQAFTWRIQALTQMDKLPAGHDGRKLHALVKYPELSQIPIPNEIPPSTSQDSSAAATSGGAPKDETAGIAGVPDATSSIDTWEQLWTQYHTLYTKHKIRFNFYQSNNNVTVSIFLKNLTKEQVALDSQEQAVKLSALGGASFGSFGDSITLLLFDKIQPEVTKWRVTPTQIELILQKQKLGRWPTLRPENAEIVDNLTLNPNTGISFKQFMDLVTALGYVILLGHLTWTFVNKSPIVTMTPVNSSFLVSTRIRRLGIQLSSINCDPGSKFGMGPRPQLQSVPQFLRGPLSSLRRKLYRHPHLLTPPHPKRGPRIGIKLMTAITKIPKRMPMSTASSSKSTRIRMKIRREL